MKIDVVEIAERLGRAMREIGVSQYRLAEISRVPQPTIQRILSGETKNPKSETLVRLANALGIPYGQLVAGTSVVDRQIGPATVPVIRLSSLSVAGLGTKVPHSPETRGCPVPHGSRTFAFKVEGDAMTAQHPAAKSYPPGCLVFVDPDVEPSPGTPVIALLDSGQPAFRILVDEAGQRWLKPINPSYPPVMSGFEVVGTVIGCWQDP